MMPEHKSWDGMISCLGLIVGQYNFAERTEVYNFSGTPCFDVKTGNGWYRVKATPIDSPVGQIHDS